MFGSGGGRKKFHQVMFLVCAFISAGYFGCAVALRMPQAFVMGAFMGWCAWMQHKQVKKH